jgi:glutamate--cysteine ligase catalytic subunit
MGLLSLGTPLDWDDAKDHLNHVKEQGILQFLNIWNKVKTRVRDELIWGDEIEYMLVVFDHSEKKVRLSLHAQEMLSQLDQNQDSSWHPEYGRYMLEATPKVPYGSHLRDLLKVEENIIQRRKWVQQFLKKDQALLTITNFPRLGCEDFTWPKTVADSKIGPSLSLFLPSEIINSHARFPTLTQNIRKRRGSKVAINVPIFQDIQTQRPFIEMYKSERLIDVEKDAKENHVYMDAMGFGMGCACLQVTFQACSVEEARRLYDQLAVITPLMVTYRMLKKSCPFLLDALFLEVIWLMLIVAGM